MNHPSDLQLLSSTHHPALAQAVAHELGVALAERRIERFANGEMAVQLGSSVRGADVFVLATHDRPVNDAIFEQLLIIDAAKRASAQRITAVCPFFGYARQDRKAGGREPISAKLVVDMLAAAGADRIVSVDLHSGQIQGFFNGPFDHLTAAGVLREYVRQHIGTDVIIVSPDAGRVKTAERYVRKLGSGLAIVHKTRSKSQKNSVEALSVVGDVAGRRCVLIDDMVDTAGTIVAAATILKSQGAAEIYVLTTHGVFSGPALVRLEAAPIDRIIATDTLPLPEQGSTGKIEVVSIAPVLAQAIDAIHRHRSVSALFDGENHG